MALRMAEFKSTKGMPPSSVPAGQMSLQNQGEPWPRMSVRNMGSRITKRIRMAYFSFRSILSPRKVRSFFGKGIL